MRTGGGFQRFYRSVSYGARGFVHHPPEGFVVHGVDGQLEVGHHVLYLGALEEGIAGIDYVRDIAAAQLLLECPGLGVGAVQDGEIVVFRTVLAQARLYLRHYAHRLVLLGICLYDMQLFPLLPFCVTAFGDAAGVVFDDGICGIHYVARAAVVALQAEHLAVGIVLLEVEYVLYLGAAEGVYRLGIVPHHTDVVVTGGELAEDEVLAVVGVLVLIHQDVREAGGDLCESVFVVPQEDVHVDEDVVEIHDAGLLEALLVQVVNIHEARFLGERVRTEGVGVRPVGAYGDEVVLGGGYAGEDVAGLVNGVVQLQLLDDRFDCSGGIRLVVDGERLGIAERLGIIPQETDENGVESAHDHAASLP